MSRGFKCLSLSFVLLSLNLAFSYDAPLAVTMVTEEDITPASGRNASSVVARKIICKIESFPLLGHYKFQQTPYTVSILFPLTFPQDNNKAVWGHWYYGPN